jgi:hypothetical protein
MIDATANTAWPAVSTPNDVKSLMECFFAAVDDPTDKAGNTLADEIFTPDGVMIAAAGTATESAGMYNTFSSYLGCYNLRTQRFANHARTHGA